VSGSRDLKPFFAPASVAVVGAAERATSSGGAVLQNLKISGYGGTIVPVNPRGGEIFGLTALRSLRELPHPVDLVVIVIRPDLILDAVREAAATGHKHLLVLPGGFAEAGAEGRVRDQELRGLADEAGITIAGPNCAGIIHLDPAHRFGATFLRDMPPGGGIAFVSQSGALAEEVIAKANEGALPVGTVVSVGNAMHLGVEDYLEYLGRDPLIVAILLYIESIEDPRRFRRIARAVASVKPVVALIGGATAPGGRAAAAHTGAVVNDDAAISAFCDDCGMTRVTSLRRLLLAAKGFGFFPQGFGRRALILSNSGGPGVLCTDRAIAEGLELPPLPNALSETLRAAVPGEASIANPLDLLADAREDRFGLTLEAALAAAPGIFDAILMIHVVPFMVDAGPIIGRLAEIAAAAELPIMHSMMGTLPGKAAWFKTMETAGVPVFNDVEAMAEAAGLVARYPAARARAAAGGDGPMALRGRSG
jgi:acetyltransferase